MRCCRNLIIVGAAALAIGAADPAWAQAANLPDEMDRQAETLAPATQERAAEDAMGSKATLIVAPLPVSTPALGTGGALAAVLYYNPNNSPTPWVSGLAGGYTSSGTWGVGLFHQMELAGDRFRIAALAGYGDARVKYYGIGADAGAAGVSVDLRDRELTAYLDGQVRIFDRGLLSNLHTGLRVSYLNLRSTVSIPTPGRPDLELPDIQLRSAVAAIGPSFTFDTRDHPFNPRKGVEVTGVWMFGAGFLGSDYRHRKLEILSNAYFPLGETTVLAVRKTLCAVEGEAPFYDLCMFGKHADLRGYEAGRYRDGATWALQAEVRHRLTGRFGIVGFAGVGGIAESSDDIWKHSHVLSSAGVGARYLASRSNNVNLRFDVAWEKDGAAVYFGIGEAF